MDSEKVLQLIINILSILVSVITRRDSRKGKKARKVRERAVMKDGTIVYEQKENELPEKDRMPPIDQLSKDLGVELNVLKAFIQVESGKFHKFGGQLVINYESHYFKRLSGLYVPDSNLIRGDRLNQQDEWRNFTQAKEKNEEAAYKSISMGKSQIMGANHKILGYSSAKEMFDAFNASEDNAIYGFGAFIKANSKLLKACRERDYHHMAYYYNGSKYQKYADSNGKTYADKIKEAYDQLCA